MTEERTPKRIADKLEEFLKDDIGPLDFGCESQDEADLVAAEMVRRGWRAKARMALVGNKATNVFDIMPVVEIRRRKKKSRE